MCYNHPRMCDDPSLPGQAKRACPGSSPRQFTPESGLSGLLLVLRGLPTPFRRILHHPKGERYTPWGYPLYGWGVYPMLSYSQASNRVPPSRHATREPTPPLAARCGPFPLRLPALTGPPSARTRSINGGLASHTVDRVWGTTTAGGNTHIRVHFRRSTARLLLSGSSRPHTYHLSPRAVARALAGLPISARRPCGRPID